MEDLGVRVIPSDCVIERFYANTSESGYDFKASNFSLYIRSLDDKYEAKNIVQCL